MAAAAEPQHWYVSWAEQKMGEDEQGRDCGTEGIILKPERGGIGRGGATIIFIQYNCMLPSALTLQVVHFKYLVEIAQKSTQAFSVTLKVCNLIHS